MSRNFSVVEPHPTVPKSGGYVGGGRGGAGNFKRYKPEEITDGQNASGPASRITLSRPFRRHIPAGRGGAGNMFSETEEPIFQFDEELLKSRQNSTPVYRIGRGGAGNMVNENKANTLSRKDSTDSSASEASERVSRLSISSIFSRRS
ncbi:hypothetical protein HII31_07627 [Pseudocercospora fuligena]|uniref:Uncharacterized protein n=1 Tax=Pseudocercospora fuligena TaxID=685502 RepID=A0A8H6VHW3_9PEZI|nr:hypothetical protein HII31_07627 [Pseudocercospora fuligena]